MSTVGLSGNDSVTLNGHVFNDFADGDVGALTFPNDVAAVKTGKNGNAIFALNENGKQAELKLRLIRGSTDDKYLNSQLAQQQANFAGYALMTGDFVKRVGDGQGNVANDTYIASGGVVQKNVEAKSNVEGDTEQSVAIWMLKFSKAIRVIT